MLMLFPAALAESGDTTVNEVVEQVGDMIETAGSKAGSFFSNLPLLTTRLVMAALVVFVLAILLRVARRMIASIVRVRGQRSQKSPQQMTTIKTLAISIINYVAYFIMITLVLSIFGVNVSSLLAVAGVGGIAIAFGAQTLVKDVISGLFIWIEGSISIGDIVDINGMQGEVESIAIRTTIIRNFNGNMIVIPNGDIRTLTNMSREFKRAIVDIRCPYEVSQERIVAILKDEMARAGEEMELLSETPDVMSILAFEPDAVIVRLAVRCPINQHWAVERELRARVKARFDAEGIVMPHYQRPVVQ